MEIITESAFAKINLTLDVLGKRQDGYHDIRSIMQTISLRDDVVINVDTDAPWAVHCYREVIEDPKAEQSEAVSYTHLGEKYAFVWPVRRVPSGSCRVKV